MASKPLAREIEAYSDAELDRYLEENRRVVRVHDPKNLSEPFIQRLRDRVHHTAPRHTIDLDQVSARLLQTCPIERAQSEISEDPGFTPALWSGSSTPLSPEDQHRQDLGYETRFYEKLIKHGGRPWYPIHRLDQVAKHPRDHRELLRFWQGDFPDANQDSWEVFEDQWGRWKDFRKWQARERKIFEGRMPEYTALYKKRLARHSFTRPFEFDEDPKQQDKLTTWIEYMSYEYKWYDRYARVKRRHKRYDEAWKKLVDSKVLRPHETEEFIWDIESVWQREIEGLRAKQAVESAKSAMLLAQQAVSSQPSASSRRSLAMAQSWLDFATQSFESFMRRNDLIIEFRRGMAGHRHYTRRAERHSILVRWVRDQIPLIESEMEQAAAAERTVDDKTGVKRGRDNEAEETRGMKRRKCVDEEEATLAAVGIELGALKAE